MDYSTYTKFLNYHFLQILDDPKAYSKDKDDLESAHSWKAEDWHLKTPVVIPRMGSLYNEVAVKSRDRASFASNQEHSKSFNQVTFGD